MLEGNDGEMMFRSVVSTRERKRKRGRRERENQEAWTRSTGGNGVIQVRWQRRLVETPLTHGSECVRQVRTSTPSTQARPIWNLSLNW